jgi:hypothetical protein
MRYLARVPRPPRRRSLGLGSRWSCRASARGRERDSRRHAGAAFGRRVPRSPIGARLAARPQVARVASPAGPGWGQSPTATERGTRWPTRRRRLGARPSTPTGEPAPVAQSQSRATPASLSPSVPGGRPESSKECWFREDATACCCRPAQCRFRISRQGQDAWTLACRALASASLR